MAYQSTLLSLLDPTYVRAYALRALGSGFEQSYEINCQSTQLLF